MLKIIMTQQHPTKLQLFGNPRGLEGPIPVLASGVGEPRFSIGGFELLDPGASNRMVCGATNPIGVMVMVVAPLALTGLYLPCFVRNQCLRVQKKDSNMVVFLFGIHVFLFCVEVLEKHFLQLGL